MNVPNKRSIQVSCLILCVVGCFPLFAEMTIIVEAGATDGSLVNDTYAQKTDPSSTAGMLSILIELDNEYTLSESKVIGIKFPDLSVIPADAVIGEAKLILYCASTNSGSPKTVVAYPFIDSWDYT